MMSMDEKEWLNRIVAEDDSVSVRREYAEWLAEGGRQNEARLIESSLVMEEYHATVAAPDRELEEDFWTRKNDCTYELYNLSRAVDPRWLVRVDPYLGVPNDLTELGLRAANTIVSFIASREWLFDGHGRAFASPAHEEGAAKGFAVLVVHHGGNEILDACFSASYTYPDHCDQLCGILQQIGVWAESLDESTSVIYPLNYPGFSIGLNWQGTIDQ